MRTPLIAGNWKLFKTLEEVLAFAADIKSRAADVVGTEILVCPSFVYIKTLADALSGTNIQVGSQNVYWEDSGAFTGEVSAPMLSSVGASHAIIGHSERRQYFHETDETVNRRLFAALKGGLVPIVCVGETLAQREAGSTFAVVEAQLRDGLKGIDAGLAAKAVIAYEPVWAIGTGLTATDEQANETIGVIREAIRQKYGKRVSDKVRIQYGGSMNPKNVKGLMAQSEIDGGLIGGASLKAADFAQVVNFD